MQKRSEFPPVRNVFLDTEVIVANNFQFDTGILASLRDAAVAGRVRVIMTDVAIRELRANLREAYDQAKQALRRARTQARVLRVLNDQSLAGLFVDLDDAEVLRRLDEKLDDYLGLIRPKLASVDGVRPSKVFARYFDQHPPFGPGKKKAEFPDAFSVEALRVYCHKNGCRITLVSGDADLQATAGTDTPFDHVARLDALLAELQSETELGTAAKATLESLMPAIREQIGARFETLGFVVTNRPAVVTRVETEYIGLDDAYVVDVNERHITFTIVADISFEAYLQFAVSSPLPSTRPPERYAPESTWGNQIIPAVGMIAWDPTGASEAVLEDLVLEVSQDIGVDVGDSSSS